MKNDLAEMRPPTEPKPTAQALAAAIAINTRTHAILKEMGVNTGDLDNECHRLTAQIIDFHSDIPMLLGALSHVRRSLQTQLLFWEQCAAKTKTQLARDMVELCQVSIAIIDTASTP